MWPKLLALLKRYSLIVFLAIALIASLWWHWHEGSRWTDLERQLRGDLTEKEKALQSANAKIGVAHSTLVSREDLQKLEKLLIQKDEDFDRFRKEHDLKINSLSNTIVNLNQQISGLSNAWYKFKGTSATGTAGSSTSSATTTACPNCPACLPGDQKCDPKEFEIGYSYSDKEGRFQLVTNNIWDRDAAKLTVNQKFAVVSEVLQQKNGNLQTQRTLLSEVVDDGKDDKGNPKYREVAKGTVVSSEFKYTVDPAEDSILDLSIFAEVGTTFALNDASPLNFGVGVNVLRYKWVGLGVDMLTDFKSWSGTGIGVQASLRPKLGSRYVNVGLAGGAAFSYDNSIKVAPYLGLAFYVY